MVDSITRAAFRSNLTDAAKESSNFISSDKIDGTAVFTRDNTKLGTIRKLMIDKKSGQVATAILGYGGLFGMGEDHYPVPWEALSYNADKGAYMTNFDHQKIDPAKAPRFPMNSEPEWTDEYNRSVKLYYFPIA